MRKPLECLRSMGASLATAILCTTRTLPEAEGLDLATGLSFTGAEDLALPNTMLLGFLASTFLGFAGTDFACGFALLFVFTAMYVLDSCYDILSAMYC